MKTSIRALTHACARALALATMLGTALAAPASALNHFGLVNTGELFVSANGGVTWTGLSTLPVRDARALIAGASSSQLFLVSESGSLYRSTDAGASWSAISAVPASDVAALAPYPGRLVLLTRSGSMFASLDAGATFSAIGTIVASDLVGLARQGTSLVAVSRTGSVYRSSDAGASWTAVSSLTVSKAVGIAAFANRLFVLTATGDIARSEDLGDSWSFVGTVSQSGMSAIHGEIGELLVSAATGEVAASADGSSWTWRGAINQLAVVSLGSDQPNPTAVGLPEPGVIVSFALAANPVRDAVTMQFDLSREAEVTVTAHDLAGREVARPVSNVRFGAGPTTRQWRPEGLPSGLYFLAARIGEVTIARKVAWVR